MPDSGGWGGEAQSDIEVRVRARNEECCRILSNLLRDRAAYVSEHDTAAKEVKIAILYGAYHIADLATKFTEEMGLKYDEEFNIKAQFFNAWTIEKEATVKENADILRIETSKPLPSSIFGEFSELLSKIGGGLAISPKSVIIAFTAASFYLFIGALDWYILLKIVAQDIEVSQLTSLIPQKVGANPFMSAADPLTTSITFTAAYVILYLQRHFYALRSISSVGIQWDRGLFTYLEGRNE